MDCWFVHGRDYAKDFSIVQANTSLLRQNSWHPIMEAMTDASHPFADIDERLRWHRSTTRLGLER